MISKGTVTRDSVLLRVRRRGLAPVPRARYAVLAVIEHTDSLVGMAASPLVCADVCRAGWADKMSRRGGR